MRTHQASSGSRALHVAALCFHRSAGLISLVKRWVLHDLVVKLPERNELAKIGRRPVRSENELQESVDVSRRESSHVPQESGLDLLHQQSSVDHDG